MFKSQRSQPLDPGGPLSIVIMPSLFDPKQHPFNSRNSTLKSLPILRNLCLPSNTSFKTNLNPQIVWETAEERKKKQKKNDAIIEEINYPGKGKKDTAHNRTITALKKCSYLMILNYSILECLQTILSCKVAS